MAFTAGEIAELGYSSLNHYMRNKPIDQISLERPWLRQLMSKRKSFPGGNDSVVEQLRKSYDSNFQWFQGDADVTYNRKQTLSQAKYAWKGNHDGYELSEDFLLSNGITLTDSAGPASNSRAELAQLNNIFNEHNEALRLGFEEAFDLDLLRDGSQDADALEGLDHLISLTPTTGVVGGIDRATNAWWQNQVIAVAADQSTTADMIDGLEGMWRQMTQNGGTPDFIMAGSNFVDQFRIAAKGEISRYMVQQTTFQTSAEFDPSTRSAENATYTGLHFQGVPIYWNPSFGVLDAADSPTNAWENRAYFINSRHLTLRPAAGHDMIPRKPPRHFQKYVHRFALTWKGALTMNKSRCHGVCYVGTIT